MTFGSTVAARSDLEFTATTGPAKTGIEELRAVFKQATGAMSDDSLRLAAAQERADAAIVRGHGRVTRSAISAELNLRKVTAEVVAGAAEAAKAAEVSSVTQIGAARAVAEAQVQAALKTETKLRGEIEAYRLVAAEAQHGSREQIVAAQLAADSQRALARSMGVTTASAGVAAGALAREEHSLGQLARGAIRGSDALGRLSRVASFASTAFIGSAGLVYAVREFTKAAEEHEVAQGQLGAAVKAAGLDYTAYAGRIDEALKALQQLSGFSEEDTSRSFTRLIRNTKDVSKALEFTSLAARIARGANIDLSASSNIVAKALAGQTTGLRRLGVQLPAGVSGYEALRIAAQKFGGSLEAYANTAAGSQARLAVAIHQTEVAIGTALLPTVQHLSTELTTWLDKSDNQARIQRDVNTAVRDGAKIVHGLQTAFHDADAVLGPFVKALGGLEQVAEDALILGIAAKAAKAATAIGTMVTAATAARTAIVAGAVVEEAALAGVATASATARTAVVADVALEEGALATLATPIVIPVTLAVTLALTGNKLKDWLKDKIPGGDLGNDPSTRAGEWWAQAAASIGPKSALYYEHHAAIADALLHNAGYIDPNTGKVVEADPLPTPTGTAPGGPGGPQGQSPAQPPTGPRGVDAPPGRAALTPFGRNQLALIAAAGTTSTADDLKALTEERLLLGKKIEAETARLDAAPTAKAAQKYAAALADLQGKDNAALSEINSINQAAADKRTQIADDAAAKLRKQHAEEAAREAKAAREHRSGVSTQAQTLRNTVTRTGGSLAKSIPIFPSEGPQFAKAAFAFNRPFATKGPYYTKLTAEQEKRFRAWVSENHVPFDPDEKTPDYDMRGYWLAMTHGQQPAVKPGAHFPDTFKTPYDTRFSGQSKYSRPNNPLRWVGGDNSDTLIDKRTGQLVAGSSGGLAAYKSSEDTLIAAYKADAHDSKLSAAERARYAGLAIKEALNEKKTIEAASKHVAAERVNLVKAYNDGVEKQKKAAAAAKKARAAAADRQYSVGDLILGNALTDAQAAVAAAGTNEAKLTAAYDTELAIYRSILQRQKAKAEKLKGAGNEIAYQRARTDVKTTEGYITDVKTNLGQVGKGSVAAQNTIADQLLQNDLDAANRAEIAAGTNVKKLKAARERTLALEKSQLEQLRKEAAGFTPGSANWLANQNAQGAKAGEITAKKAEISPQTTATFDLPIALQVAAAKAGITATTSDDKKVAERIKEFADHTIESKKLTGQALIDAIHAIGEANATIGPGGKSVAKTIADQKRQNALSLAQLHEAQAGTNAGALKKAHDEELKSQLDIVNADKAALKGLTGLAKETAIGELTAAKIAYQQLVTSFKPPAAAADSLRQNQAQFLSEASAILSKFAPNAFPAAQLPSSVTIDGQTNTHLYNHTHELRAQTKLLQELTKRQASPATAYSQAMANAAFG